MAYTNKQRLFAVFMMHRIGMVNEESIETYINYLETLYGKMDYFPSENYYGGKKWFWSVSKCIDLLKDEIDLKKDLNSIVTKTLKFGYSATDLSNFTFCPASFSINQTFKIEKPNNLEVTETGAFLHEQLRLLPKASNVEYTDIDYEAPNPVFSDPTIQLIRNSKNIFCGHIDSKDSFTNGNFSGIPDYIFQDKDGKYFIVEEKFHKKRDPRKITANEAIDSSYFDQVAHDERTKWENYRPKFFPNHLVQTISYLKNITSFKIDYGYLIYWYYDFKDTNPYVHKVGSQKIVIDSDAENLYRETVYKLEEFRTKKSIDFPTGGLNMKKCAGCAVNKYCGHKTGKYQMLTYPYEKSYLKLYYAEFPTGLKKN